MTASAVRLGAVAYDPKVVTIWFGFRDWFAANGVSFDFLLYSNYESQVEVLLNGDIDVAWNSPLAWVRARRVADARSLAISAVAMRDTDRNLVSVIVTRADSTVNSVADLRDRVVGTGAVDSPQATLLPLSLLRKEGLDPGRDVKVQRFDIGVGLHGDHIGGEREAARALLSGAVDAACMIDANHLAFSNEGLLPAGATRVIAQTDPYDHCNMTAGPSAPTDAMPRFLDLLFSMSYEDPDVRPLLDLEGLHEWMPGRTDKYDALERAVDEADFYGSNGDIRAREYRPR